MTSVEMSYKESISKQLADGLFSTTEHFCLVPESLYQKDNCDLWLNFGKETIASSQEIRVNYIPSQNCYLLWEKDSKAEKHIIEALLTTSTDLSTFPYANAVICAINEQQMIVALILQNKLQIATIYRINTQEDMLYHLLNIYTQWQLDANTLPTYLIGANASTETFLNQYILVE